MPFAAASTRRPVTDLFSKLPSKLFGPRLHGLVRNDDTALCQKIFDHSQAQWETEIQPDRVGDNIRLETVTVVEIGFGYAARSQIAKDRALTFRCPSPKPLRGQRCPGPSTGCLGWRADVAPSSQWSCVSDVPFVGTYAV